MAYGYLTFQDPAGLALGVFIVLFAIFYFFLNRLLKNNRGMAILISFAISAVAAWKLLTERFYGYEETLAVFLIILVIAVFIRIFWGIIRKKSS